jgi:hypothetical protein
MFGATSHIKKRSDAHEGSEKPKCEECGYVGEMVRIEQHGCTSISWMVCLFFFTGVLFWIPMVRSKFKDVVTVCPGCERRIDIQYADCI